MSEYDAILQVSRKPLYMLAHAYRCTTMRMRSTMLAHAQYFNTCLPSLLFSRLSQQQEVLEKQISLEDQVIKQSEEKLDGLQPALDTLQRASLPLQDMLGLPVDKMREEESLARLLPELAFLYTLSLCIRCCKENRYVLFS